MICITKKNTNPYKSIPSLRVGMGLISCGNLTVLIMNKISASQLQKDEFQVLFQLILNGLVLGLCLTACLVWVLQGIFLNNEPVLPSSTHLSTAPTAASSSKKSTLARHWSILRLALGSALSITHLALGIWLLVKIGTLRSEGHSACLALDEELYSQALCYLQILTASLLIVNALYFARESYLCWKLSHDTVFLAARKERREDKENQRLAREEIERGGAIPLGVTEYRPDLSLTAQEPHGEELSGDLLPVYTAKDYRGGTVVDVHGRQEVSGSTTATSSP